MIKLNRIYNEDCLEGMKRINHRSKRISWSVSNSVKEETMEIKQLKRRGKILWFVRYGPDASHMWDAKPFTKLREAREFAKDLPETPTGGVRPFVIERYEYVSDNVYGDTIRVREVK